MKMETVICDAINNTMTVEMRDYDVPEWVDYAGEIEACKQRLAETDYVVIKIAEGAATREEYADIIKERKELREKIRELEALERAQTA